MTDTTSPDREIAADYLMSAEGVVADVDMAISAENAYQDPLMWPDAQQRGNCSGCWVRSA
jgi:hypothetical protein